VSLVNDIRGAVAAAATAVDGLLIEVQHESFSSVNADGKPSYNTAVTRRAFLTSGTKAVFRQIGAEGSPSPTLIFIGNVAVDVKDRITLPDGVVASIVEVKGTADPDGGTYYTEVRFGRPERGSVT